MKTIGFIGMGNMAQAMLLGLTTFTDISANSCYAYAPNYEKLCRNADQFGFNPEESLDALLDHSEVIFMACKPYQIEGVLESSKEKLKGKTIISVAFGWDYDTYMKHLSPEDVHVQYILPNTPVSIGEGVIFMEKKDNLSTEEKRYWTETLSKIAKVIHIDGSLIPAGSAIGGCAPAFVDVFIEGLSDGGVKNGLPRDITYEVITQMMIGTAKMMQSTGLHPGQLKDQVCSPGGTTIKGVAAMEEGGVRSAMIKAVDAACGK